MSKIPRVIFRFSKLKSAGIINAAHAHNSRNRPTLNANSSVKNVVIKECECDDAYSSVLKKIGNQTIRKNGVLAVEIIISASPQYFRPNFPERYGYYDEEKLKEWRDVMEPWISEKFPHSISTILHLDEATPHYQILTVPLDEAGKLNARKIFGGDKKSDIKRWQDWAAEPVKKLGIMRGIEGSAAKHQSIKHYYSHINVETPKSLPPPKPIPPPIMERTNEGLIKFAHNERALTYKSFNKTFQILAAKAKVVDSAVAQKNAALITVEKLVKEKAALKKSADLLRELPISDVLKRVYNAEISINTTSIDRKVWILGDGREISVGLTNNNSEVWMEPTGKLHRGAINLIMHLDNLDYKDALRLLSEYFDSLVITAERTAQFSRQAIFDIKEIINNPLKPPVPHPENWPKVKKYLTGVRSLPSMLVDWMYAEGKIYADKWSNAVFKREIGGAFLHGTTDKVFTRAIGNERQGSHIIEGVGDIWLCSSPLDAMSIKAHCADAYIFAIGDNILRLPSINLPIGNKINLAFNDDHKGRNIANLAIKQWPLAKVRNPPSGKNWSAALNIDNRLVDDKWLPNSRSVHQTIYIKKPTM